MLEDGEEVLEKELVLGDEELLDNAEDRLDDALWVEELLDFTEDQLEDGLELWVEERMDDDLMLKIDEVVRTGEERRLEELLLGLLKIGEELLSAEDDHELAMLEYATGTFEVVLGTLADVLLDTTLDAPRTLEGVLEL